MTTNLSPAAQAVMDAWGNVIRADNYEGRVEVPIAAALKAVAEHCVPDDSDGHWVYIPHVLAIAAELEAVPNSGVL
jgi:hypothetical protein